MSAETSRKFAWLGKTRALRDLTNDAFNRVTGQINHAESEKDFTAETLAVIKQGEQEMKDRGGMI
jgi:hypothetical protein